MQSFIQRLAQFLTSWEATTFLIGEYVQDEMRDNPVFTVADGLFWLSQVAERNSVVRKLQIMKLRGQASVPGLHTIRISDDGLQAFSRTLGLTGQKAKTSRRAAAFHRHSRAGQDDGRGHSRRRQPPRGRAFGDGQIGAGHAIYCRRTAQRGAGHHGDLRRTPARHTPERAGSFGLDLKTPQEKGKLEILYLRPLDLSVDETMQEILDAIERVGAKRLVIDSLVGFEMALAPGFRDGLSRVALPDDRGVDRSRGHDSQHGRSGGHFTALPFSHYAISFLTDDIIRLRYVEIDGQLRKVMVVVKMRGGNHSKDIREYVITDKGVVVISPRRTEYHGLITGIPKRTGPRPAQEEEAAPEKKATR